MSDSTNTVSTPKSEFLALFGTPPCTQPAELECKMWEQLCGELLAERDTVRKELLKLREQYFEACMSINCEIEYQCPYSIQELVALVAHQPSIPELIAEVERDLNR